MSVGTTLRKHGACSGLVRHAASHWSQVCGSPRLSACSRPCASHWSRQPVDILGSIEQCLHRRTCQGSAALSAMADCFERYHMWCRGSATDG
eukprot:4777259-Alexandrium_andersonii.AAC.1